MDVVDEVSYDSSHFVSSAGTFTSSGMLHPTLQFCRGNSRVIIWDCFLQGGSVVCQNVTLALDYKLYWKGNGITSVTLTRTVGNITLNTNGKVTSMKPSYALTYH